MNSQIYKPVIRLEIHAQLLTKTRLFCCLSTKYRNPPGLAKKWLKEPHILIRIMGIILPPSYFRAA